MPRCCSFLKRIKTPLSLICLSLFFILIGLSAFGQGIKGTIRNSEGEALPFATLYIASLNSGATSNVNGEFEIKLPPGKHPLQIQHMGYEIQKLEVEIGNNWVRRDFTLKQQAVVLKEVEVNSKAEDPAYTIMRKAIAKKKFHRMQYNSYKVKVYMKGTGILTKAPFFLKKKLKEEGVKLDEAFTSEKVSKIYFSQPDKVQEKVISIRASGDNNGSPSPTIFIHQGFYKEKIGDFLSPLARSAFSYYKFRYMGSFREGDIEVNKIKVTPRSKGEQVFKGYIYIIEDLWAIHSLDLHTSHMGFPIHAKQNFAEVAPKVWLPVTHQYEVKGNTLGFEGTYKYQVSCMDYELELNQDLIAETEIIDEKIEEVPEDIRLPKAKEKDEMAETLANEDKMSRKQFRKLMESYEKETIKAQKEPEVIRERKYTVDSLATKKDAAYWDAIRPSPLTAKEIAGYQRDDSLAAVKAARLNGKDSLNVIPKGKFKPQDIFLGGNYNLFPRTSLRLYPNLANVYYNTIEGINVNLRGRLRHEYDSLNKRLDVIPTFRYGFSSNDFYAKTRIQHQTKRREKTHNFYLEGGNFVQQFNPENPIHPHINTLSTLLFRKNYMKLYEKQYATAGFSVRPGEGLKIGGSLEWARRSRLFNQTDYSFFFSDTRVVGSNQPRNIELSDTGFPRHEALIFRADISYRPGLKYMIYNDRKIPLLQQAPELLLSYRKGISGPLGSDVDFDQLELGINHQLPFGVRGKLEFGLGAGVFLNKESMFFMDYKHFDGNRTILSSIRPAGAFRLLDYYLYSTNGPYFSGHTHYQFRKFLLTQLPELRFSGLRENIFFNYLKTGSSPHYYYEVGYSIDRILNVLRLEVAASFNDKQYKELGLRIGVATILRIGGED